MKLSRKFFQRCGAKGGSAKSEAKAKASRLNGTKGGPKRWQRSPGQVHQPAGGPLAWGNIDNSK